jgi:hypothetical protein
LLGHIGPHNVVIVCLPAGVPGATLAATMAADMQCTFKRLRISLLVGVGSSAPSAGDELWLSDVIVSQPTHDSSGVIQFEWALQNNVSHDNSSGSGSGHCDQYVRGPCLIALPTVLLTAQLSLKMEHMLHGSRFCDFLAEAALKYPCMRPQFAPPLTYEWQQSQHWPRWRKQ